MYIWRNTWRGHVTGEAIKAATAALDATLLQSSPPARKKYIYKSIQNEILKARQVWCQITRKPDNQTFEQSSRLTNIWWQIFTHFLNKRIWTVKHTKATKAKSNKKVRFETADQKTKKQQSKIFYQVSGIYFNINNEKCFGWSGTAVPSHLAHFCQIVSGHHITGEGGSKVLCQICVLL